MKPLILASTSPYRRAQLAQLGLSFVQCGSGVDEDLWKQKLHDPGALALALARAKAEAVATIQRTKGITDAVIIAGDQVAAIEGDLLDKPGSAVGAVAQLKRLAGRTHDLLSAVAVLDMASDTMQCEVVPHAMTMRPLLDAQIQDYVALDQPFDCVGSYRIEALGIALFSSIQGLDHSAIMGLPLMTLTTMLEACGVSVFQATTSTTT